MKYNKNYKGEIVIKNVEFIRKIAYYDGLQYEADIQEKVKFQGSGCVYYFNTKIPDFKWNEDVVIIRIKGTQLGDIDITMIGRPIKIKGSKKRWTLVSLGEGYITIESSVGKNKFARKKIKLHALN